MAPKGIRKSGKMHAAGKPPTPKKGEEREAVLRTKNPKKSKKKTFVFEFLVACWFKKKTSGCSSKNPSTTHTILVQRKSWLQMQNFFSAISLMEGGGKLPVPYW